MFVFLQKQCRAKITVRVNVAVTIILSLFTFRLGFIKTWTASGISKWVERKNYKKSLFYTKNMLNQCHSCQLISTNQAKCSKPRCRYSFCEKCINENFDP